MSEAQLIGGAITIGIVCIVAFTYFNWRDYATPKPPSLEEQGPTLDALARRLYLGYVSQELGEPVSASGYRSSEDGYRFWYALPESGRYAYSAPLRFRADLEEPGALINEVECLHKNLIAQAILWLNVDPPTWDWPSCTWSDIRV